MSTHIHGFLRLKKIIKKYPLWGTNFVNLRIHKWENVWFIKMNKKARLKSSKILEFLGRFYKL